MERAVVALKGGAENGRVKANSNSNSNSNSQRWLLQTELGRYKIEREMGSQIKMG